MRKLMLLMLVVVMIVVGGPLPASADTNTWNYEVGIPDFDKFVAKGTLVDTPLGPLPLGPNVFISNTDVGIWKGMLEGTSFENFVVVIHKDHATYQGRMTFEGTVDGKEGTLVIKTNGSGPWPPVGDWSGRWVILSGTDDLSNLRGQGSWWGPLPTLEYDGKVHFTGKK